MVLGKLVEYINLNIFGSTCSSCLTKVSMFEQAALIMITLETFSQLRRMILSVPQDRSTIRRSVALALPSSSSEPLPVSHMSISGQQAQRVKHMSMAVQYCFANCADQI
jgi:hypothetical protein